ncbi:MAG: trypsin-like peptidase domain-containing protein [Rubripirellula sp.]
MTAPKAVADSILIAFSSSHCPPCEVVKPTLAELERSGIPVRRVDVQVEPQLVARFGVRQTPTFVVVSAGKEVTRLVGVQSAQNLRAALAIDPSGPLIPTRSTTTTQGGLNTPQTHLAILDPASGGSSEQLVSATQAPRDSEPMPSLSLADAVERAHAATVRLRVHDAQGYGAGTGTIIDTHGDEALVLTCGHLFRENQGKGKIEVDLFVGGRTMTVPGQVIDFDADARDIALVSIKPGFAVQPVQVIGSDQMVRNGQPAFSFGCDRGNDPSRRDTRITGINKYNQHLGVSNLEIAGAPIDGRSGGGLFDATGRLVGVCNSADYKEDVGIYAGPGNVHWQLQRIGMLELLASTPPSNNQNQRSPARLASQGTAAGQVQATAALAQPSAILPNSNQELIVIIRDKANPAGNPQVMTLQSPTAELLHLIQSHTN